MVSQPTRPAAGSVDHAVAARVVIQPVARPVGEDDGSRPITHRDECRGRQLHSQNAASPGSPQASRVRIGQGRKAHSSWNSVRLSPSPSGLAARGLRDPFLAATKPPGLKVVPYGHQSVWRLTCHTTPGDFKDGAPAYHSRSMAGPSSGSTPHQGLRIFPCPTCGQRWHSEQCALTAAGRQRLRLLAPLSPGMTPHRQP